MLEKESLRLQSEIKAIENIFWESLDCFRDLGWSNGAESMLFLLSAFRDGLFDDNSKTDKDVLHTFHRNLNSYSFYSKIFPMFSSGIPLVSLEKMEELTQLYSKIDRTLLEENFGVIFENILSRILIAQKNNYNYVFQPIELSRLMIELANVDPDSVVYNPFAGYGSLGVLLKGVKEYHGQEINPKTWALTQLRFKAHNTGWFYGFELTDSIGKWNENQKFDLIMSTPPFKLPIPKEFKSTFNGESYYTVSEFLIDKGINSLTENGKLITVLPLSFLSNEGKSGRMRKALIENNNIDTIIELPSGLFANSHIKTCLIVFKRKLENFEAVKFVDATTFLIKDGNSRRKILNLTEVLELINQNLENEFLKYVSIKEIRSENYNLSVGRYFLEKVDGIKLSNFAKRIKGDKIDGDPFVKQIKINDLKEYFFDSTLDISSKGFSWVQNKSLRLIQESCVLIATVGNSLKPTYFHYTGDPIAIHPSIIALNINEELVEPLYLISEFSAAYVKQQLNSYRTGSVQYFLKGKDIENVVFKIPSLKEQRAKVSGVLEYSEKLKALEIEREHLERGIKEKETESSTSLSHVLGTPLLGIGSSLEIIQVALTELSPGWKGKIINKKKGFTLLDAFETIGKNIKYIQELVDENTALVNISSFELSELDLIKFLKEFTLNEKKVLSIDLNIHRDIKEEMYGKVLINGNEKKLRIVFENLIENAKRHAFFNNTNEHKLSIEILPFTENKKDALSLNYEIDTDKTYIEVKVSNTGNPFPKDFTLQDYVRKNFAVGETGNKGLGGYEVNEILKGHNMGKKALNLTSNLDNEEFSSTIAFIIPIQ